ncbi:MAG: hypothetical protein ABI700_15640 [Chloroflexota bacterium]
METPLTILYTHNLRGDLDALPRLYSFLRQLKAYYSSEEVVQLCSLDPAQPPGTNLLLDLGDNCAPDVWHCQVSEGRSTLVVLDGMGYDAVRVEGAAQKQAKMGESVRLKLIDGETPLEIEDVLLTAEKDSPLPVYVGEGLGERGLSRPHSLQIVMTPSEPTRIDGKTLFLAGLNGSGEVGAAQLTKVISGWALSKHEIHELPRRALPDPTISAAVEFVISEARYAQKRRSS